MSCKKNLFRKGRMLEMISYMMVMIQLFCSAEAIAQRPELIIPATHVAATVLVSPDDKWLVSAGYDGVKIWDNKTRSLMKNLSPGGTDVSRFNNGKIAMAINNSSSMLAMQFADSLFVFSFDHFSISNRIYTGALKTAIAFSADGRSVFTAGTKPGDEHNFPIEQINLSSGATILLKTITISTVATHEIDRLFNSPSGNELLVYDAVMGSWIISIPAREVVKEFTQASQAHPYAYLQNGNLLGFGGGSEKTFYLAELDAHSYQTLRKSKTIFKDMNGISSVENVFVYPSAQGKLILYSQGLYTVFDPADFSISDKREFPATKDYYYPERFNIAFSPSGNYFVMGTNMSKNNLVTNLPMYNYGEVPLDAYVQFVYKNTDGICLKDRTISFENGVLNLRMVTPINRDEFTQFMYRLTSDGKTGFMYNAHFGLFRFDATKAKVNYEPVPKINAMKKDFVGMQVFDKLNLLTLIGDEGIYVLDLATLKVLYIVDIPYGMHYATYERLDKYCDISPDNSKMILFADEKESDSSFICCVDLSDKNEKWFYKSANIHNLRFTDNSKQLMFTAEGKLFRLDAETGKETGPAIILPGSGTEAVISPSGNIAATRITRNSSMDAGADIGLINVSAQSTTGTMPGTGDGLRNFVFLKNERYMITEEYGGLCLWDTEKQKQIGKIYMFERSGEWVFVTPDGRFDATEGALKKLYFTRGKEVIPLESLFETYFVPGLLKQVWNNTLPDHVPDIKDIKSLPLVKISLKSKERNLEVSDDAASITVDHDQALVKIDADGVKDVISEMRLYQDGKLVENTRNLVVEDDNKGDRVLSKSFAVTLHPGVNRFKAVAINSQRTESIPAELQAIYTPAVEPVKPPAQDIQLYMLVVGVNTYKNPKYSLNYAGADANAFTKAITDGGQQLFSKINTIYLKDEQATRSGILAAFEQVKQSARPQDLFLFYYAGHGMINDKNEFFLVPYDVTQLYGNDNALAQNGFSAAALQQMSKDIKAQKQLFILDACQSAGALVNIAASRGAAEEKAIAQLARSTGTQWLTASGSEQFASEFSQLGHGSFTYCLLEAFKGDASGTDKKLTVKQLDAYLQNKVPEITQKYKGTPQYPASYSYGNDFPIIIIP